MTDAYYGPPGMTQADWIQLGIDNGWCAPPVCDTHDGLPMTEAEYTDWNEGFDPCVPALRLLDEDTDPVS